MKCSVRVGSPLRSYTGGKARVQAELSQNRATVGDVLVELDRRYPGIRFRMIDEQDRVRRHIRLFVNSGEVRQLGEPVADGDTLHLVGALSGG